MASPVKQKFTLDVEPTFQAPVDIPRPGKSPATVQITFKYRERDEFNEFVNGLGVEGDERKDGDVLMEVACGWDLAEPFDKEHVDKLVSRFAAAGQAIMDVYIREQKGARAKN